MPVQPSANQLKFTAGLILTPGVATVVVFVCKLTVTVSLAGWKSSYLLVGTNEGGKYAHLLERYM